MSWRLAVATALLAGSSACEDDEKCTKQPFPTFEPNFMGTLGTRVPLDVFCQRGCPASESAFAGSFQCYDALPEGGTGSIPVDDAGIGRGFSRWWARVEGCGSVQFYVLRPNWPTYYNFSLDAGALIGAGRADDVATELSGTSCEAAAYVAGTIGPRCPDAAPRYCEQSLR